MNLRLNVQNIDTDIAACTKCELRDGCERVNVGEGSIPANILFVGDAPGQDVIEEDEPRTLKGRSGKLFREILEEINFSHTYYMTTIVKCATPNNTAPFPWDIETCIPHLIRQVKHLIKPLIIVGLGDITTRRLIDYPKLSYNFFDGHGKIIDLPGGYKFMGIYHPASALRSKIRKATLIEDLHKLSTACDAILNNKNKG